MVVRVKVRLTPVKGGRTSPIETIAVLNAGYESSIPEVAMPEPIARELGFLPKLPKGARKEDYYVAMRRKITARVIPGALDVTVLEDDKTSKTVRADAVIAGRAGEVLLSDRMLDSMGIILVKPGEGIWRFFDDDPQRERVSRKPE